MLPTVNGLKELFHFEYHQFKEEKTEKEEKFPESFNPKKEKTNPHQRNHSSELIFEETKRFGLNFLLSSILKLWFFGKLTETSAVF